MLLCGTGGGKLPSHRGVSINVTLHASSFLFSITHLLLCLPPVLFTRLVLSSLVLLCLRSLILSPLYFISCLSCVILDGEKISPTMQFIYDVLHHSSMKATRPWVHNSNLFSYFYVSQISPVKDLERYACSTHTARVCVQYYQVISV
jgi:hypothetical protein